MTARWRFGRKKFLPGSESLAEAFEIEVGERVLGASEVSESPIEDGTGAQKVGSRLVVEGHGKLNQSLKMAARWQVARHFTPGVFESFVGVEKVAAIEEFEAALRVRIDKRLSRH